jgi:hypothetical protein
LAGDALVAWISSEQTMKARIITAY